MPVEEGSGRGGLPTLVLTADGGARAELYLHGAQVTSWAPASDGEQLFLSARSAFHAGTAVRGGIPVIFPQFGPGPLPKHGFARTSGWEIVSTGHDARGAARATLALRDSDATRRLWPFAFAAELSVAVLGRTIAVSLGIGNPGPAPLAFTGALHTYLAVADVAHAAIEGLAGVRYRDQAAGRGEARSGETVDRAPELAFDGEVDRLYVDAPGELRLRDGNGPGARVLGIESTGFPDAVVWNPGAAKARQLDDLGDDEYRRMVCVEAAAAARPVLVAPGERWAGEQRLTLR